MREASIFALALTAGMLLGAIFYGGLWWTIRSRASRTNLGVWLMGSFLLRATLALGGFYFASRNDWRILAASLLGFVIGRISVTWLTRAPDTQSHRARATIP